MRVFKQGNYQKTNFSKKYTWFENAKKYENRKKVKTTVDLRQKMGRKQS